MAGTKALSRSTQLKSTYQESQLWHLAEGITWNVWIEWRVLFKTEAVQVTEGRNHIILVRFFPLSLSAKDASRSTRKNGHLNENIGKNRKIGKEIEFMQNWQGYMIYFYDDRKRRVYTYDLFVDAQSFEYFIAVESRF